MQKFLIKCCRWIFWILTMGAGSCVITALALFIVLQQSSIDIRSLVRHLPFPQDTLKVQNLTVTWPKIDGPLEIKGHGIEFKGDFGEFSIPDLNAQVKPHHLLQGRFLPRRLTLSKGILILKKGNPEPKNHIHGLKVARRIYQNLLQVKDISIHETQIIVQTDQGSEALDLTFELRKKIKDVTGTLTIQKDQDARFETAIDIDRTQGLIHLKGTYHLKDHGPLEKLQFITDAATTFGEVQGAFTVTLQDDKEYPIHTMALETSFQDLDLLLPKLFPGHVPLGSPKLVTSIHDNKFNLTLNNIVLGAPASNHGGITLVASGAFTHQGMEVQSRATIKNLNMAHQAPYWPPMAAEGARTWLVENITKGLVPDAFVEMDFRLKDFEAFTLEKLKGEIHLENALLSYTDTMPKVQNLFAHAFFDHRHFDIKVLKGTNHGLNIAGGRVIIGNFDDETVMLKIDADVTGDLKQTLDLINHPPLYFAKDFALNPDRTKGDVKAHLTMEFPLLDPFDTDKISTKVTATSTKTEMRELFNLPITLKDGTLNIKVNDARLQVQGDARVNKSPSKIDFVREFSPKAKFKEWVTLSPEFSPELLLPFEIDLRPYWKDADLGTIEFKSYWNGASTLTAQGNLKNSKLEAFGHNKPKGTDADFKLVLGLQDYDLKSLKDFTLTSGADLRVKAQGHFTSKGTLTNLSINPLQMGPSHIFVDLKLIDGKPNIQIQGESLSLKEMENSNSKGDDLPFKDMRVDVNIKNLSFGGPHPLKNVKGHAVAVNNYLEDISLKMELDGEKDKNKDVHITLVRKSDHYRKFKVTCQKAGNLFQALDVAENVRGGQMQLLAYHDSKAPSSNWEGKLELKDFSLLEAPFLGRLVSLVFPVGITDLRSDGGLGFKYAKVRFVVKPNLYEILNARAHGNSLGVTFAGTLSRESNKELFLQGTIIPAYILNSLFSKIPLIGSLLTGGKHEGLFGASYKITGTTAKPEVNVNPLSAFTPGLLRKIFSEEPENGKNTNDLVDDPEDLNFKEEAEDAF